MAVKTYLPDQFKIIFGTETMTGLDDGDFITVSPGSDRFSKVVGADGEVIRTRSNDYTHDIEIVLLQSSSSNDYLSTVFDLDRVSGTGALPLSIVDLSGTTVRFWASAWIVQEPAAANGKESGNRTWTLTTGQETPGGVIGGNN